MEEKLINIRTKLLKNARRIVIKAGSGILTGNDGFNNTVINSLTNDICDLRSRGIEVILVSFRSHSRRHEKNGL